MGLSQALATSISGLRTSQTGMSLIASNVANAQTPGYIRKTVQQVESAAAGAGSSVRVSAINRELDTYLQRQLRVESAGSGYADMRAQFYERLQMIYGDPNSDASLESIYNGFTTSLQALAASPDSVSARSQAVNAAQVLAQQLNGMTQSIQGLRSDAESALSDATRNANEAMRQIASINEKLSTMSSQDQAMASLLDQRDGYLDQLSGLMDISVVKGDHNSINVFTTSGIQLVGTQASQLQFDSRGALNASSLWSTNSSERGVGTLTLVLPNGGQFDLIANSSIRSGQIASLIEMRDKILPQAQTQLDSVAASLASALSDKTTAGTAVTSGLQTGLEVDAGGLQPGNSITFSYTDNATQQLRKVTVIRVDDPSVLPLKGDVTADPNDQVIGLDFSGGMASVAAQLNSLFNGRIQFSNPSGDTLRVLDDGAGNITNVTSLSVTRTISGLSGGSAELPFFMDSFSLYTGAVTAAGMQSAGFAGRISVNASLSSDPSKLVSMSASTAAGDPTRPNFILDRLSNATFTYAPATGLGTKTTPFTGSVSNFMRQMLSMQGEAAANASSLASGQKVVVSALQERFTEASGVNIDQEMANLITLQTAYGANARVLSAARDMIDMLLKM